jgi:hypothetical protein
MQLTLSILCCRAVWSSGVFCVLCAAFIFALTALLVKLTGGRVPVLEITLYRSGISLVVSAGETRITRSSSWPWLGPLTPPPRLTTPHQSPTAPACPSSVTVVCCYPVGCTCSHHKGKGHHSCHGAPQQRKVPHPSWRLW